MSSSDQDRSRILGRNMASSFSPNGLVSDSYSQFLSGLGLSPKDGASERTVDSGATNLSFPMPWAPDGKSSNGIGVSDTTKDSHGGVNANRAFSRAVSPPMVSHLDAKPSRSGSTKSAKARASSNIPAHIQPPKRYDFDPRFFDQMFPTSLTGDSTENTRSKSVAPDSRSQSRSNGKDAYAHHPAMNPSQNPGRATTPGRNVSAPKRSVSRAVSARSRTPHPVSSQSPTARDDGGAYSMEETRLKDEHDKWKREVTRLHEGLKKLRADLENCMDYNDKKWLEDRITKTKAEISNATIKCAEAKNNYEAFVASSRPSNVPGTGDELNVGDGARLDSVAKAKQKWEEDKARLTTLHRELKVQRDLLASKTDRHERDRIEMFITYFLQQINDQTSQCAKSKQEYKKAEAALTFKSSVGPSRAVSRSKSVSTPAPQTKNLATLKARWDQAKVAVTKAHADLKSLRLSEASATSIAERQRIAREIEIAKSEISSRTLACADAKFEYEKAAADATSTTSAANVTSTAGSFTSVPALPAYPGTAPMSAPTSSASRPRSLAELDKRIAELKQELESLESLRKRMVDAGHDVFVEDGDPDTNHYEDRTGAYSSYAEAFRTIPLHGPYGMPEDTGLTELEKLKREWDERSEEMQLIHNELHNLKNLMKYNDSASLAKEFDEKRAKFSELTRLCAELMNKIKRLEKTPTDSDREIVQHTAPLMTQEEILERQRLYDVYQEAKRKVRDAHNLLHNLRKMLEATDDSDTRQFMSNSVEDTKRNISIATNECAVAKKNYEEFIARFA